MLRLGAGLEAKASDLLAQPNSDSLLLVGVHHGSVEWLELLLWRVRQAINTGKVASYSSRMFLSLPLKGHP